MQAHDKSVYIARDTEVLTLVLTRKLEQKIRIGDDIILTIIRIKEGEVSIGFDAPRHVCILREELARNPKSENNNRSA